jgi:hypothetical protein
MFSYFLIPYRSDVAEKANGKLWNVVEGENRREQGAIRLSPGS